MMMMIIIIIIIAGAIILGPRSNCDFSNINLHYLDVSLCPLHSDVLRNTFQQVRRENGKEEEA